MDHRTCRLESGYNAQGAPPTDDKDYDHLMIADTAKKGDGTKADPMERLTPDEFRTQVLLRGWTYRALAERWGKSENWISKIARNPHRPAHYDDAVRGLPRFTSRSS